MKYKRFNYDLCGKLLDITSNYLVFENLKDNTLCYLKGSIIFKLKAKIGKHYYITLDNNKNILSMLRIKYDD